MLAPLFTLDSTLINRAETTSAIFEHKIVLKESSLPSLKLTPLSSQEKCTDTKKVTVKTSKAVWENNGSR